MEDTLTSHQEDLIEADAIVQATLAQSIDDPGEVLASIIEAALFKPALNDKEKLASFEIVRNICLTAYENAVNREANSIGMNKGLVK